MKNYFSYLKCEECGKRYDPTSPECPNCKRESPLEEKALFEHDVHVGWIKNLLLFLVGFAGFQILGYILSFILQTSYLTKFVAGNPGASMEERQNALLDYAKTPDYMMIVNGVAYGIVAGVLMVILWKGIKEYARGWKGWKPYLAGLVGFFALIVTSISWSFIVNIIRPATGSNANQSTIVTLAITFPVISTIIFGVIGPVCEEFTYRIGLFSLSKRVSRIIAYIVTPLVFGLIHFGWGGLSVGGDALITELLNIPDYILAGLILSFLYDRFGIGASTIAHVLNNLFSFFQIFLLHSMGQL